MKISGEGEGMTSLHLLITKMFTFYLHLYNRSMCQLFFCYLYEWIQPSLSLKMCLAHVTYNVAFFQVIGICVQRTNGVTYFLRFKAAKKMFAVVEVGTRVFGWPMAYKAYSLNYLCFCFSS